MSLAGRVALLVDDCVTTGLTARAACEVARAQGAARVVLAAPVIPARCTPALERVADDVVRLRRPESCPTADDWFEDRVQLDDAAVTTLLAHDRATRLGTAPATGTRPTGRDVLVPTDSTDLPGHLTAPPGCRGIVVFAHGSGSGRHSPRNRLVAARLHAAGFGTLLFDLFSAAEEHDRRDVFDVDLLGDRLLAAIRWLRGPAGRHDTPIGLFGAGTGAAAALSAAARAAPGTVSAIVSRGGRPDLALPRLGGVTAPTLLVVGGADPVVVDLNRAAQRRLRCTNTMVVVAEATHLFTEPWALESVAGHATDWFSRHL